MTSKKGIYRRLRLGWHSLKKEKKKYHKQNCNIKNLTLKFKLSMEKNPFCWGLNLGSIGCKTNMQLLFERNLVQLARSDSLAPQTRSRHSQHSGLGSEEGAAGRRVGTSRLCFHVNTLSIMSVIFDPVIRWAYSK